MKLSPDADTDHRTIVSKEGFIVVYADNMNALLEAGTREKGSGWLGELFAAGKQVIMVGRWWHCGHGAAEKLKHNLG